MVSSRRLTLSLLSSHAKILPVPFIRAARWTVLLPGAEHASRTFKERWNKSRRTWKWGTQKEMSQNSGQFLWKMKKYHILQTDTICSSSTSLKKLLLTAKLPTYCALYISLLKYVIAIFGKFIENYSFKFITNS